MADILQFSKVSANDHDQVESALRNLLLGMGRTSEAVDEALKHVMPMVNTGIDVYTSFRLPDELGQEKYNDLRDELESEVQAYQERVGHAMMVVLCNLAGQLAINIENS